MTATFRRIRRILAPSALAVAAILAASLHAQNIEVNKDNRTVAVTATEHVVVTADIATVHIGYITYGRDRDTTYANATKLSNTIIQALTASGVPADSIESDNQSLEPTQNFQVERLPPAEAANRKYQVQQSWIVRTGAANAAKLLDTAVLAGANQSGQIDWSLKDESASTASASARAIQHAHRVAIQMVSGFGGKVGALLYASNESESTTVRPVPMMAMHKAANENEPLAISPRRIERSVTVRAIFAIE